MDRILHRTSLAIIQERLQTTRQVVDGLNKMALELHIKVANTMAKDNWGLVNPILEPWGSKVLWKTQRNNEENLKDCKGLS